MNLLGAKTINGRRICLGHYQGVAALLNAKNDEEAKRVFCANAGLKGCEDDVVILWPDKSWHPNQKLLGAMSRINE